MKFILFNLVIEVRSTVVGDELLHEGKRYRIDEYGFKLVTVE